MPPGVQLALLPVLTVAEVLLATTLVQAASLQSWKLSVPLSPASGSVKVAVTWVVLTREEAVGAVSVGVFGATVSTTKLGVADQLDQLPAASWARARQ